MNSVSGWGTTRPNWPRSLQAFVEFFPDIPQPLELPPAQQRAIFPKLSEALARALEHAEHVLLENSLGRRIHAGAFNSSGNRIAQLPV